jgi:hypothetical protein|tara:strand:+ start:168 stop:374 length:207 start_codon:yes stop_codon:yes gene_type:complete
MKSVGKGNSICDCCGKVHRGLFYEWTGMITGNNLGLICEKCALRESFGSKYKQNRRYKKWLRKKQRKK